MYVVKNYILFFYLLFLFKINKKYFIKISKKISPIMWQDIFELNTYKTKKNFEEKIVNIISEKENKKIKIKLIKNKYETSFITYKIEINDLKIKEKIILNLKNKYKKIKIKNNNIYIKNFYHNSYKDFFILKKLKEEYKEKILIYESSIFNEDKNFHKVIL